MSSARSRRLRKSPSDWKPKAKLSWVAREITSLSNIIRHGHATQLEVRPFLLSEASDDALYESTWGTVPTAVIRHSDRTATVHTFHLIDAASPSTPAADTPATPETDDTVHAPLQE